MCVSIIIAETGSRERDSFETFNPTHKGKFLRQCINGTEIILFYFLHFLYELHFKWITCAKIEQRINTWHTRWRSKAPWFQREHKPISNFYICVKQHMNLEQKWIIFGNLQAWKDRKIFVEKFCSDLDLNPRSQSHTEDAT